MLECQNKSECGGRPYSFLGLGWYGGCTRIRKWICGIGTCLPLLARLPAQVVCSRMSNFPSRPGPPSSDLHRAGAPETLIPSLHGNSPRLVQMPICGSSRGSERWSLYSRCGGPPQGCVAAGQDPRVLHLRSPSMMS